MLNQPINAQPGNILPQFSYDFTGGGESAESTAGDMDQRKETLQKVGAFICERIIARHHDRLPSVHAIAVRLIVLMELISPTGRSLRGYARELDCTESWLSQVATEFSASIGMRAPWQRPNASKNLSAAMTAVHNGTWTAATHAQEMGRRRRAREKTTAAGREDGENYAQKNGKESIKSVTQRRYREARDFSARDLQKRPVMSEGAENGLPGKTA